MSINGNPVDTLTRLDADEKAELRARLIAAIVDYFDEYCEHDSMYGPAKSDRYGNALVRAIDEALRNA